MEEAGACDVTDVTCADSDSSLSIQLTFYKFQSRHLGCVCDVTYSIDQSHRWLWCR